MRFSDDFLRTLKERVSIAQYAGRKLSFDRRKSQPAKGDYWACCPFHGEKTPSFHILDRRGLFHCFGCGENGGVIDLAMKLEGLSFPEAVTKLADEAGMALPTDDARDDPAAKDRRARLLDATRQAAHVFEKALRGAEGKAARAYLLKRGLDEEACARFGLGYAPEGWTWGIERLTAAGFRIEELVAAGLAKPAEDGKRPIDVFRGRIIFPIADPQGRIVAFGGRALDPAAPAKYLNSPETELFHKGRMLYRLKEARETLARRKGEGLIVAEGYLDVIAFERAGLPAVAPLGTALTEDQLALLWRAGPTPIMCFDGDSAGLRAADRALELALPQISPARTLRFALLSGGQDPDDLYRSQGADALAALIEAAIPAAQRLFEREKDRTPLTTPEARAGFKARLKEAAGRIADEETKGQYLRELLRRADEALGQGRRGTPQGRPGKAGPNGGWAKGRMTQAIVATAELKARLTSIPSAKIENLLREATHLPTVLDAAADTLAEIDIADPDLSAIRHALLNLHFSGAEVDQTTLKSHLTAQGEERAQTRVSRWPAPLAGDAGKPPTQEEMERRIANWRAELAAVSAAPQIDADLADARTQLADENDGDAFTRAIALARAKVELSRAALKANNPEMD
jgi:DNA primase